MAVPGQEEFIEAALKRLGMTKTELGVEMRKPNAYATVHAWSKGRVKLGYEDTMKILDICGWLNMGGADQPAAEAPHDPLVEIAATVAELARGQAAILESLRVPQAALEQNSEPVAQSVDPPKATRKRAAN